MVPLRLYTPQTQNGATLPLYPTNPERRHTAAIPHMQEHEFLFLSVHERAFFTLTPRVGYHHTAHLLYLIHFIPLTHSMHLNHSIHLIQLIQLIHLILLNSLNSMHLIHFQFTYLT